MQLMAAGVACIVFLVVAMPTPTTAKGLASDRRIRGSVDAAALERELGEALGEVLGCGGEVSEQQLAAIETRLASIWSTLPKNGAGNIERRSLRHLVHRYFLRHSALQIRGFEPSRPSGATGWGDADVLAQRVPAFVESFLESNHKNEQGFNLGDVARVVATIDRLIFDSEGLMLEKAYAQRRESSVGSLDRPSLERLLEAYMIRWMLGDEEEVVQELSKNRKLLEETIPHWQEVVAFTKGEIEALDHRRRHSPTLALEESAARAGHNAMEARYSFEDSHRIVGDITRNFASFWDSECRAMKGLLVDMDTHHMGRVPLSKFYSHGLDTEWRFGESEEYLRELGALDETGWRGKQVIIPNYIQATSNCIVSSEHYLVCCQNDCEGILEEIEARIGEAEADPSFILEVVANITSFNDQVPQLKGELTQQLQQIASASGGRVMLHGRLFAQWLHYVFPQECPFPHKTGMVSSVTPMQYGEGYIASPDDMKRHAADANTTDLEMTGLKKEDLQWMSQWSTEEELVADYAALGLRSPWGRLRSLGWPSVLALLLGLGAVARAAGFGPKAGDGSMGVLPVHSKAHFV